MSQMQGESKLNFLEATGIIVGHGVGAGILSVPYLASHNSFRESVFILIFAYLVALVLHLIIAELSYNNNGAQFVKCFDSELFAGKIKTVLTWTAFILLGVSVIVNVSAFLTGAAAVFAQWFGLPDFVGILVFYVLGASVVFVGMKLVGICEKYAVIAMVIVMGVIFVATLMRGTEALPTGWRGFNNALALFGMISFSLSAVMSTPQVVKGLGGDKKRIRSSIALGLAVNASLIFLITLTTLLGTGGDVSEKGAFVDLARRFGGWVAVVGYVFTLLALATSFWANTLNLRDIVSEQTGWGRRLSWLIASLPCLVLAMLGLDSFVGFTRFASIIQVVTGIGIIVAYNCSRRRVGKSPICGVFGSLPFQILVVAFTLLASVGAVMKVG
ncbi:MAG: hypothetical protein KIG31_03035 [Oscillospiraceae bacterium]|nr:hypothetical protein [Oscillospiraceae bacterium]